MSLLYGKVAGSNVTVPVQVDANGVISVKETTIERNAQNHGYSGGAWRKSPIAFGISGVVKRAWSNTSIDPGISQTADDPVPSGEVWIITVFLIKYTGTVPTNIQWRIGDVSGGFAFAVEESPTSNKWYEVYGFFPLEEGDFLEMQVVGGTAGDDIFGKGLGYKMDIDL